MRRFFTDNNNVEGVMQGMKRINMWKRVILFLAVISLTACASREVYKDPKMDFGSILTVAVMPFTNLTREPLAADRVRDVFMTMLLAAGDMYVLPPGEVARGLALAGVNNAAAPSNDESIKLAKLLKADAVITAVIREYGEVRSGQASANVISFSIQMVEVQTGRVVLSVSTTEGGIGIMDRLFGGGGEPMNTITEKTVKDVVDRLYK
jgi:hypothetical protein